VDGLTTVNAIPTPAVGVDGTVTVPYTTTYTMVSSVSDSLQSVVTTQTVYAIWDNTSPIGTDTGVRPTQTLSDTGAMGQDAGNNNRRNAAIAGGVVGGVILLIIIGLLILRVRNKKSAEHWRNKDLDWKSAPSPNDLPYDGSQPIVRPQPAMRSVA